MATIDNLLWCILGLIAGVSLAVGFFKWFLEESIRRGIVELRDEERKDD